MSSGLYAIPRAVGCQPIRQKNGCLDDGGYCANSSHMDLSVAAVWLIRIGKINHLLTRFSY